MSAAASESTHPTSEREASRVLGSPGPRRLLGLRSRYWAVIVGVVVVTGSLVLAYDFTVQPRPPFHQKWSFQAQGNPSEDGITVQGLFVTYESTSFPLSSSGSVQEANFSLEGINVSSGVRAWWTPMAPLISGTFLYAKVFGDEQEIVFATASATPYSNGALDVTVLDGRSGGVLSHWNRSIPWYAAQPPQSDLVVAGSHIVTWFPTSAANNELQIDVIGLSLPQETVDWNFTLSIPGGSGWGAGSYTWAAASGDTAILELVAGPNGAEGLLVAVNATTGAIMADQVTSPTVTFGAVVLGSYYFLAQNNSTLLIDSVSLTTGAHERSFLVRNVADNQTYSAGLAGIGGYLIVESYSPFLNYAAYTTSGSELWQVDLPWATSCGPAPDQPAFGPCASLLTAPVLVGGGEVLLESLPSTPTVGSPYTEVFELVNLTTGVTEWSFNYSFTFGQKYWPWQSPEPSFRVDFWDGGFYIYTVETAGLAANWTEWGCGIV